MKLNQKEIISNIPMPRKDYVSYYSWLTTVLNFSGVKNTEPLADKIIELIIRTTNKEVLK